MGELQEAAVYCAQRGAPTYGSFVASASWHAQVGSMNEFSRKLGACNGSRTISKVGRTYSHALLIKRKKCTLDPRLVGYQHTVQAL